MESPAMGPAPAPSPDAPHAAPAPAAPRAAPAEEARQRAEFDRMRRIATGMLVVAALLFAAAQLALAHAPPGWPSFLVALLRSAAEAAVVGGVADWFAVTALFRQPLGLPIPHTGLVPKNKARIGEGLGRFVETNFLAPEIMVAKLRTLDLARRLGEWLVEDGNARLLAERTIGSARFALFSLQDRDVRKFFRQTLEQQLSRVEVAPLMGKAMRFLRRSGDYEPIMDQLVTAAIRVSRNHEPEIREFVARQLPKLLPGFVGNMLADKVIQGLDTILFELMDRQHPTRARLQAAIDEFIARLIEDPEMIERGESLKRNLLESEEVRQYLAGVWDHVKGALNEDGETQLAVVRTVLTQAIAGAGRGLLTDPAIAQKLNHRIEVLVAQYVVPLRGEIGRFIAEVVNRWDTETVTERLELAVGRDLQFIRINGTVVGALVGAALFLVSQAVTTLSAPPVAGP